MNGVLAVAAVLVMAVGCLDPTAPTRQGISNGGGGTAAGTVTLRFTGQPSPVIRGQIIVPRVEVTAVDSLGARDSSFTANVTVAIGTNPVGGTLGGTRTVAAVAGVASFGDLTVNRAANRYTLVATAPGARSASSQAFDVSEEPR